MRRTGQGSRMRTIISLLVCGALCASCVSGGSGSEQDAFITVIAVGNTEQEARNAAMQAIVEQGLGSIVQASSMSVDAQARQHIVSTAQEGYVSDFEVLDVLKRRPPDAYWQIRARGRVSEVAVRGALETYLNRYRPRLMLVFAESIEQTAAEPGRAVSDVAFVQTFSEFPYVDQDQLRTILGRERNLLSAHDNDQALRRALQVAAELSAEVLVVGRTEVRRGTRIANSNLTPMHATVRVKLVNVGSGAIISASSTEATQPHLDAAQGSQQAIRLAMDRMRSELIAQVERSFSRGNTIRVTFENISYDAFIDNEIESALSNLGGVNTVRVRGTSPGSTNIEVEVEARLTGSELYTRMRAARDTMNIDFQAVNVRDNTVQVRVTRIGP